MYSQLFNGYIQIGRNIHRQINKRAINKSFSIYFLHNIYNDIFCTWRIFYPKIQNWIDRWPRKHWMTDPKNWWQWLITYRMEQVNNVFCVNWLDIRDSDYVRVSQATNLFLMYVEIRNEPHDWNFQFEK